MGPSTRRVTLRSVPDTTAADTVKGTEGGSVMKRHVDCLGGRLIVNGEAKGSRSRRGRRSRGSSGPYMLKSAGC